MRSCLLLFVFKFIFSHCSAQIFHKSVDGQVRSFDKTFNNGFIIAGVDGYNNPDSLYFYLIYTDSVGNEIWSKQYDEKGIDVVCSIKQTEDSGFIVTGFTSSFGNGEDVFLMKTNNSGNVSWFKTYGTAGDEQATIVKITKDKGYIIGGTAKTNFGWTHDDDNLIIKTDSNGSILWKTIINGHGTDFLGSIDQLLDENFILVGNSVLYDSYINILDNLNGSLLWTKSISGAAVQGVKSTFDGGFIICGVDLTKGNYVCKFDSAGDIQWEKTYRMGYNAAPGDIKQTSDSGFIFSSYIEIPTTQQLFFYPTLIRLDQQGDTIWTKCFIDFTWDYGVTVNEVNNGYALQTLHCLIRTGPNGFTGCNEANYQISISNRPYQLEPSDPNVYNLNYHSGFVTINELIAINTTQTTCINLGLENLNDVSKFIVYPNPSTGKFLFQFTDLQIKKIKIYNNLGQIILDSYTTIENGLIDLSECNSGFYFIKVETPFETFYKKIVKQ